MGGEWDGRSFSLLGAGHLFLDSLRAKFWREGAGGNGVKVSRWEDSPGRGGGGAIQTKATASCGPSTSS